MNRAVPLGKHTATNERRVDAETQQLGLSLNFAAFPPS